MTATALQTTSVSERVLATGTEAGWTVGQIELIKDTIAKDTTDDELMLFLYQAKKSGLDPFARQIYCIKRWDGKLNRNVAQTQTSIDGFRLIANRTGQYVPGRESEFQYDKNNNLIKATAFVKIFKANSWHEVSASAFYSEYVQTTKDGAPNAMWKKMPHTMLAKCAESLALRKAFPAELSGLYTSEEMGSQAVVPDVTDSHQIEPENQEPRNVTPPQKAAPLAAPPPTREYVPPKSEEDVKARKRISEICEQMKMPTHKILTIREKSNSMTGEELQTALSKMEASFLTHLRGLIQAVFTESAWDENDMLEYFKKFGVLKWDDATPEQINAIYDDLKTSQMIKD